MTSRGYERGSAAGMTIGEVRGLALKLAAAGFHVFPLGLSWNTEKGSIEKKPLSGPGFLRGFLDASTDLETVERMFNTARIPPRTHPGVGIVPGPSGFTVLDVDIKNGGTGADDLKRLDGELGELLSAGGCGDTGPLFEVITGRSGRAAHEDLSAPADRLTQCRVWTSLPEWRSSSAL